MNPPDDSLPHAEESTDITHSHPNKIIIPPRRIGDHAIPKSEEKITSAAEPTSNHRRRRRRSARDFSSSAGSEMPDWNWKIMATAGVLAVLLISNFVAGRFFYQAGLSEGILRAVDARTPSNENEEVSTATTNKAFAALLNLRNSKPDRPSIEMLTLLALQALSQTQDDLLPSYLAQGHTTPEDFCAAYVAMRQGDFGKAAAILRATESSIPPDLFDYLMNDAVMRRFAKEPRVMGFYEKS